MSGAITPAALTRTAKTLDSVLRYHFGSSDSDLVVAAMGMWLGAVLRRKGSQCAEEFLFWLGEDVMEVR